MSAYARQSYYLMQGKTPQHPDNKKQLQLFTIGHSTRPLEEFIALLRQHTITQLVDVRSIPHSRHNPQYEQSALMTSLPAAGIAYIPIKNLGGIRPRVENSINTAWHNLSFRNYADYMQTPAFTKGIDELIAIAKKAPTAIMCAEAVPWRCHRSLIGDTLFVHGVDVVDIITATNTKPHTLTSFAVVHGREISYPHENI